MSRPKLAVVGNPANNIPPGDRMNAGETPEPTFDWKAFQARLDAAGLKYAKAESTPEKTEPYTTGKGEQKTRTIKPGQKEKFRVVRTDGKRPEVLGYGYSPSEAVSAAIFLYGDR